MTLPITLIVGLGNPGPQYAKTRHNVGAWFVARLANNFGVTLNKEPKLYGHIGRILTTDYSCLLLVPTTFMNISGQAVQAACHFYKIPATSILLAYDELDFAPGVARFKQNGSSGGHNGVSSVIAHLGTKEFLRLRFGIGHPGYRDQVTNYVLANPNRDDQAKIIDAIDDAISATCQLLKGNLAAAIQQLHLRKDNS